MVVLALWLVVIVIRREARHRGGHRERCRLSLQTLLRAGIYVKSLLHNTRRKSIQHVAVSSRLAIDRQTLCVKFSVTASNNETYGRVSVCLCDSRLTLDVVNEAIPTLLH